MIKLKAQGLSKSIRLNKFIADNNICSRRDADKLIDKYLVHINDKVANLGDTVSSGDSVSINIHNSITEFKYYAYHKPRGEVTGPQEKLKGCHPLGNLDKESDGLLIYTSDYRLNDTLLNPENNIEKEYTVVTREKMTERVRDILLKGIFTQEGKYKPAKRVDISNEGRRLRIVICEGKKHEIRRMLNALHLTVMSLTRTRFHTIKLLDLKPGMYKEITLEELKVKL